jgi:lysozyme family protein
MADFAIAYGITNSNEGGWQNDPTDSGNSFNGPGTYKGIASAKQPQWKGWTTVKAAIANMTKQPPYGTGAYYAWVKTLNATLAANTALQSSVQSFYQTNFWDANSLGGLNSQDVANKVYDSGVNQGVGTAAIMLQKCCNAHPDGCIGPVTLKLANAMDGAVLAQMFRAARIAKYHAIVAANPADAQYLDTWLARC